MVDALRRAHRIVAAGGLVVDLHPSASPATIDVDGRATGSVSAADGPLRHAAAGAAIAAAVDDGLFAVQRVVEFFFYTYADTIEELREYIEENWRDAHVDGETIRRTTSALAEAPGVRPRSRERVILTVLSPLQREASL
jgi:hypothetical protein